MKPVSNAKIRKFFLAMLRAATRPLATRSRGAARVYYWADLRMQPYKNIWLLPAWFYRLMSNWCNVIASINTIDYERLRSPVLQKVINWLIHRIPAKIRFCDLNNPHQGRL